MLGMRGGFTRWVSRVAYHVGAMTTDHSHRYAVVVAGGSGTRLWPLSRKALPKQMQALMSEKSLIAETVDRLEGVIPVERIFVSTTENYLEPIRSLLPGVPRENYIVEPEGRGPTVAFALLASTIVARDPEAVVFSLASDHAVTEVDRFRQAVRTSLEYVDAHPGEIAVVGITPTRADTGLGYIRVREPVQDEPLVYRAGKYVEKPSLEVARDYVQSGQSFWNAAYYCFRAQTLLDAYADANPLLVEHTAAFLKTGDLETYRQIPGEFHEIDIIDSAKYPIAVVPGDFRWSDIGNWSSLHRTLAEITGSDVVTSGDNAYVDVESHNVFVRSSDGRRVVVMGMKDVGIICTDDAVVVIGLDGLESSPEKSMKVLLERLRENGMDDLL